VNAVAASPAQTLNEDQQEGKQDLHAGQRDAELVQELDQLAVQPFVRVFVGQSLLACTERTSRKPSAS
jgi:hypothetical protein